MIPGMKKRSDHRKIHKLCHKPESMPFFQRENPSIKSEKNILSGDFDILM